MGNGIDRRQFALGRRNVTGDRHGAIEVVGLDEAGSVAVVDGVHGRLEARECLVMRQMAGLDLFLQCLGHAARRVRNGAELLDPSVDHGLV
jgi:hypothetical protein